MGRFTARQLRLAFLTQLWNAKIDFSESLMTGEVKNIEATLNVSVFFCHWHGGVQLQPIGSNVKSRTSSLSSELWSVKGSQKQLPSRESTVIMDPNRSFQTGERPRTTISVSQLESGPLTRALLSLEKAQADFRAALCDSFNTPVALDALRDLVSKTNVYINSNGKTLNVAVVTRVARWVGDMLRVFGLGEGPGLEAEIGWGQDRPSSLDNATVSSTETRFKLTLPGTKESVNRVKMG